MADIYKYDKKLQKEIELLKISTLSEGDKALILEFKKYLEINNFSKPRIIKLLNKLRLISIMFGKNFKDINKNDVENFVLTLREKEKTNSNGKKVVLSPVTKQDYIIILKRFFKWYKGNDETYPSEVSWIKGSMFGGTPSKLPEDLMTEEEIKQMISSCHNIRDKALIAILADSGQRIGEILSCRLKHVHFKEDSAEIVSPTGKTGPRRVLLIPSVPYLLNWCQNHPLGKPDDPLFVNISNKGQYQPMNYTTAYQLLRKAAKRAGISKRTNAHQFRHKAATKMANHLSTAQLNERFGWSQDSRMPSVYIHMSGRDSDDAVKRAYGKQIKIEDSKSPLEPKVCSYCSTSNGHDFKYCSKCARALNIQDIIEREKKDQHLIEFIQRIAALKETNPKVFEVIKDLINPES